MVSPRRGFASTALIGLQFCVALALVQVLLPGEGTAQQATDLVPRHPDDGKFGADNQAPYPGSGWTESEGGSPSIQFPASGIDLRSWITLDEIAPGLTDGSDCWGYTSPSGREYALIGTNQGLGVVEVTDPGNAQVITHVAGVISFWRDVKTFGTYAYVVSEGGGGIQVIDLSDVDNGNVTVIRNVLHGGVAASHNVAINSSTARLYQIGGGSNPIQGIRVYSLRNPSWPQLVGEWHGRYCHDAQIVTWTGNPFYGKEVAFCFADDTPTGVNAGVDILDISNPAAITLIGTINLKDPPIFSHPAWYSHQGWLSYDSRYLYVNDEVDEEHSGQPTTTRVIDVQDLANPQQVAIFQNTMFARDHNLYTRDTWVFEANYRAGLRVLDASDPFAISEIRFFDTYPPNDDPKYNGLWSVYPYFKSGTIIGSDIEKGLFVWSLTPSRTPALGSRWVFVLAALVILTGVWLVARAKPPVTAG